MIISGLIIALLLVTNGLMVWYIKKLITIIEDTKTGISDMKEAIAIFSEHLQIVYKQDTFYGEPTIERLIKHSKLLVEEMDQFVNLFLSSTVSTPKQQEPLQNDQKTKQ
jgi:hypothetical protein